MTTNQIIFYGVCVLWSVMNVVMSVWAIRKISLASEAVEDALTVQREMKEKRVAVLQELQAIQAVQGLPAHPTFHDRNELH